MRAGPPPARIGPGARSAEGCALRAGPPQARIGRRVFFTGGFPVHDGRAAYRRRGAAPARFGCDVKLSATVELNKAHWPVTVLGPGRRVGLWLQGCSIRCQGCVSQDTWPRDAATRVAVADLLGWCRRVAADGCDGVTISGGEPFDQPAGLLALLRGLAAWREQAGSSFDVLCYSGYPLARLQRRYAPLLALIDAIVPEPYVDGLPLGKVWRGSANQPLVPLTDRGRVRYAAYVDQPAAAAGKRMQAAVEGGRVWMIGIPERGDMAAVEALCANRGLALAQVSWRR